MLRRLSVLMLVFVLVGCGSDDEGGSEESAVPSPTPAPTSVLSGYSGPLLNTPDPNRHAEDCSIDDPDGECGISVINIDENALPLALTMQDVSGVMMGIPDGFEVSTNGTDEAFIETTDAETHPGDFFVIVERGTSAEVETLLNRYANLDHDRRADFQTKSGDLNGYRLPNGDLGMVAIIELDPAADQYLMMQGIVVPGYWPQYEATFVEMTRSIELPTTPSS